jgi:hypothetical protein
MDAILFFKAIGNLVFAAILFMAVIITATFSVLFHIVKESRPLNFLSKKIPFLQKTR